MLWRHSDFIAEDLVHTDTRNQRDCAWQAMNDCCDIVDYFFKKPRHKNRYLQNRVGISSKEPEIDGNEGIQDKTDSIIGVAPSRGGVATIDISTQCNVAMAFAK